MTCRIDRWLTAWVITASTLFAARAPAGAFRHSDDQQPPSSYSCWHYWTPMLYRIHLHCHGPRYVLDQYPPAAVASQPDRACQTAAGAETKVPPPAAAGEASNPPNGR
jgi:hypothetical protein